MIAEQLRLFADPTPPIGPRQYHDSITVAKNRKGVVEVDTVKGCSCGMAAYPANGCYGACYAHAIAKMYGIDFTTSVVRSFADTRQHRDVIIKQLIDTGATWYRVGVMGDPCHAWDHTLNTIRALKPANMAAVIVTKHWKPFTDNNISRLLDLDAVVHTSTSGMDTDEEIAYRVGQTDRLRGYGIKCINRVVTCKYGDSEWGRAAREKQAYLLSLEPVIDNPFRVGPRHSRVASGDIIIEHNNESVGGGKSISLHSNKAFIGRCEDCPDQCGVDSTKKGECMKQASLFDEDEPEFQAPSKKRKRTEMPSGIEFKYVPSVIGSGYEKSVAEIALEDGIAHRAARKNMQIHSAIIVLHNGEFAGFMTFQNNHDIGEFCLLQSVINPNLYSDDLYRQMVLAVIDCNTNGYPMLMTTNPKSKFETPKMFQSIGFHTYLAMSGFEYMLSGDPSYERMKVLAHITMCNVWDSVKGKWLAMKKEWNQHIEASGLKNNIANPTFASREGCWQGENGFANVVTGRSHNGNASVLDPVVCEVILRFFTPREGKRVYNPFGGGVQFGYVAGASGYEYIASEIRQNQCDANNILCSDFKKVQWVKSDSSTYRPKGKFDLVFTCPPYYKVEKYLDYDGTPPPGEINNMTSYEEFRDTLFRGYEIGIECLQDNRFFVVMTGDSRDKNGAYHCHEAETELFFKDHGLSVYNKIVYLECEFTRLAHAKKTLHKRKFPKREQKIIVAYKGKISSIGDEFASIGRL